MKSKNFDTSLVYASAAAADTEFAVTHGLTQAPKEAFVVRQLGTGKLYKGSTAWTASLAYFKSDAINTNFYLMFIV